MQVLVVVAHPDDEVLGAGATIHKLTKQGFKVSVCILSGNVEARDKRPNETELYKDIQESNRILGVCSILYGHFPNIKFNSVPHLDLVQFIEKSIIETKASIIITHHPSDVNNDHLHTSLACQAAIRLFQRRCDIVPIQELMFMEVPSATDWCLNSSVKAFSPNTFFEVGEDGVNQKLRALAQYRGVMRPYPHPRSEEAIKGLSAYRGAQSGCQYAEAFECVFRRT